MKLVTYRLVPCPHCRGMERIKVVSESGIEIGTWACPFCKTSVRPGYVLEKIERGEVD